MSNRNVAYPRPPDSQFLSEGNNQNYPRMPSEFASNYQGKELNFGSNKNTNNNQYVTPIRHLQEQPRQNYDYIEIAPQIQEIHTDSKRTNPIPTNQLLTIDTPYPFDRWPQEPVGIVCHLCKD